MNSSSSFIFQCERIAIFTLHTVHLLKWKLIFMGHISSSICTKLPALLSSSPAFYLNFIVFSHKLNIPHLFWISFVFATRRNPNSLTISFKVPPLILALYFSPFLYQSIPTWRALTRTMITFWYRHLSTELGVITIVGGNTYRKTLYITTASRSKIPFFLGILRSSELFYLCILLIVLLIFIGN
jgi:ABC-type tungstate transport system substrate-binding protein